MQNKLFCILLVMLCVCAAAFGGEAQAEDEGLSPFSGSFADAACVSPCLELPAISRAMYL